MARLDFVLVGRDHLSRVLDRAGDASDRLGRRLLATSINGDAAVRRFTNNATRNLAGLERDSEAGGKALGELRKATMLLAPAAIPAAASLAPVAAGAGAVAVAAGVMVAAIIPQVTALADASEAQKKYEDAVAKSGATSQEAVQAQLDYQRTVSAMPPATRQAAAGLATLKKEYQDYSDSLAQDTMTPVTKSLALFTALLPKTRGLVKDTAGETDRFVTLIGGQMASPGLDRMMGKFDTFSTGILRRLNDELVHLMRTGDGGRVGGNVREFMDWARAQGPTVASVLRNVGTALIHVLDAGSDVGVGLLQVVDAIARLVSAVPPSAIAMFLQLALALKLTKTAALGLAAGRTALVAFAAQLMAMQTAAAGAPGRLRAVGAAIGAMSRSAKVAMAGTGIGLLLIALTELSQRGRQAPPDVDKLTSSLKQLGSTGKVTGEAAKAFGSDLDGLYGKVRSLTDPSTTDKVQQFLVGWTGWDSTPVKEAKENLDAVDKALAGLVQSGQPDIAAAAVKRLTAEYGKGGRDTKQFTKQLDDYKSALADSKFEQQLAADSMGLFGAQAVKTQTALNAQKQSADGLRQSIQALNDVQRQGLGGMIGFEAAVDAAAKAARDNAGALSMSHGQLNLNSEKARNAATALQDLAQKTDEAAASARQSGSSWGTVNGIYERGRAALIRNAQAMGLTRSQAERLAAQILKIPDKTARVKMNAEDAKKDLASFNAAVRKSPSSKSVTLKTLSSGAEQILKAFGYKVTHLKNGSVRVSAVTGSALGQIHNVQSAVNSLHGKTVTVTINGVRTGVDPRQYYSQGPHRATGGLVRRASGGPVQAFPAGGYVSGPGTATSDSILAMFASGARAMVSNSEYVLRSAAVARYGVPFLDALNSGRIDPKALGRGFAQGGGLTAAGGDTARGLAVGMTGSTSMVEAAARGMAGAVVTGIKDELQIASPSKRTAALAKDVGAGLIKGLTGSKAKIASTSKDLAKDIWAAFTGRKDNKLVAWVNKQTKTLTSLAGKRDSLIATIKRAKDFAETTRVGAKQSASLGGMFSGEEEVTAGGISAKLQQRLTRMKTFTSYIKTLVKRGLNKTMLREILTMGPEEGYAYASALAGANSKLFKEINSTQYKINDQAESLGKTGADALYDSGKNAGKGFLKGLQSQQAAIEKQMLKIAKGMDKAIRKALGIKSPSTVMAQLGMYSTQGLARGLVGGMPHLDRALSAVTGRVAGIQPIVGRPAVTARGSAGTAVQIDVHGALDPVATAREIRRVLLELKRVQGVNVTLGVG